MFKRKTALEKEWKKLEKQEQAFLNKHMEKDDSKLNQFLNDKIPTNLQNTLDIAFSKAFHIVFEKGTGYIEKMYNKDQLEKDYKINEFASNMNKDKKSLRTFSKKAKRSKNLNLLFSGVSGIGLGILGIGIPDIALFTGIMLKNIYEIALSFGYNYESENEKKFILLLIEASLSNGKQFEVIDKEINSFIKTHLFNQSIDLNNQINQTSSCLSKELLYMKFIQGIPIVGAIGGAYDVIYLNRISKYAELKYRKRFYYNKMKSV